MNNTLRNLIASAVILTASAITAEPYLVLEVDGENSGVIEINLRPDLAPKHVERIVELTRSGAYDGVVFHRVIEGFMAQTGDVQFGRMDDDISRAGSGGSELGNLAAEFTDTAFEKGVIGMARSSSPNSANSQFFIMLAPGRFLDGQYTVFGEVVTGQDVVDAIKKGDSNKNGMIDGDPDYIKSAMIVENLQALEEAVPAE